MLVLSDQATPAPLRRYLTGHRVRTTAQQGWGRLRNGELISAGSFDAILTTDKNMRYQQNLGGRKVALVVLGHGQWRAIRAHVQRVVDAVNAATPGSDTEVDIPFE